MHGWHVSNDDRTGRKSHSLPPGLGHGLLAPFVSHAFEMLGVQAAVWEHGMDWLAIHVAPNIVSFEYANGRGMDRASYNGRSLEHVTRTGTTLLGTHAGYSDFFVPILLEGKTAGVLVSGPFATAAPTSEGLYEQWRALSGRQGHVEAPAFSGYVAAALATLVLEAGQVSAFRELLECLTGLMSQSKPADELANRASVLQTELEKTRLPERTWGVVDKMLDERATQEVAGIDHTAELERIGLSKVADDVLVGLAVPRKSGEDPVDEWVRRNALQRRVVDFSRRIGDVIAGRVGEHGVVFVSTAKGSREARRRRLVSVAERAAALAEKEYGLLLHFGMSFGTGTVRVPRVYQAALAAAESALVQGKPSATLEPEAASPIHSLRHLRKQLSDGVEEHADVLVQRFERYLDAVVQSSGFRIDVARTQLEAGFERLAEPLVRGGTLDARSFETLVQALDRAASESHTVSDLLAAYRRAVSELSAAVQTPSTARQDRGLSRAIDYIHQHYAEPLRVEKVARMAGFARSYFSRLFREREKMTFENYLRNLRLERAKQLLTDTNLDATRVAELSGFRSSQYFSRAFRAATGDTPLEFRARRPPVRAISGGRPHPGSRSESGATGPTRPKQPRAERPKIPKKDHSTHQKGRRYTPRLRARR